jgi:hypothetical protein
VAGIKVAELNRLEVAFLQVLDFEVHVENAQITQMLLLMSDDGDGACAGMHR